MEGWRVEGFIQLEECGGEVDDDDAICPLSALPVVGWLVWC